MTVQEESILDSIKKLLGIDHDFTDFDPDIIIYINSALMVLSQIGIGNNNYNISGYEELWSDFLESKTYLSAAKSYVYLKCRLIFDPPANSFVTESINKQLSELEFRLNVRSENKDGE